MKKINNKSVYYSDKLNCEHFFTTRELEVKENKNLIAEYLKVDVEKLIHPHQTHSANIKVVSDEFDDYNNIDSLILNKKDYAVYLNFADCTPVILYDEQNNVGAVIHCGWRGTAQNIVTKTVLKLKELYNSNPRNIVGIIGPSISFSEFETYDEALNQLKQSVQKQNGLFNGNYADLKGINKQQLIEIGVKKIDICPFCTVLDNDKFFSYRKENKTTKRHSAVLKIK